MRIPAFIACLYVASDCAGIAAGNEAKIFAVDALWIWWVVAFMWVGNGIAILFYGAS